MKFQYDEKLGAILRDVEEYIVWETPRGVGGLAVTEPAYAVFLWYDDSSTHPDHIGPDFGVGVESLRPACAEAHDHPASVNDLMWAANTTGGRWPRRTTASCCAPSGR